MPTPLVKRVKQKAGKEPGMMVWSGPDRTHPVTISVITYSDGAFEERLNVPVEEALVPPSRPGVTWIDINGIHDVRIVEQIGRHFGLHPLVLEDIVTTGQRPKLEDYGGFLFLTVKMLSIGRSHGTDHGHKTILTEELSIIFGKNFLLSFQETEEDSFRPVKDRLRKGTERLLKSGPDYLAYALVDMVVDNYFTIIEEVGDLFENMQNQVLASPTPTTLRSVYRLKNDLVMMRKAVWPLRDALAGMQRHESELITHATELYLRDVQDHTIQVMDTVETLRDMLAGTVDIYLSGVSNRLNQVMKVLTMIATIFIPLTFIVGVYGMNFDFMPELHWRYGYFVVWGIMLVAVTLMLWWFKRNKWW